MSKLLPVTRHVCFSALALSSVAGAAEREHGTPLVSEVDLFAEVPIVVSATRLAQRTDQTPVAVTVIDRETIEASGAVELVDLLRLVPGFQVAMTTGNLTTVTAHGTGTPWFSRMQVLVDGRSVYHTTFSGLDWSQLGVALADVERIEAVRGPNIAAFGANAIQGTVNIVTRHPVQDRGVFMQATAGSWNRRDAVLRYGGGSDAFDYRLTAQHRENDGFDNRLDGTEFNALSFRGLFTPTTRDEFDIQLEVANSRLGEELFPGFFPSDVREVDSSTLFVRWTHAQGSNDAWQLQFNRSAYDSDEDARLLVSDWYSPFDGLFTSLGLTPGPDLVPLLIGQPDQLFSYNQFETESLIYDVELQRSMSPHDTLRFTLGAGYRWEEISNFLTGSGSGTGKAYDADSLRLFGSVEWQPSDRWVVTADAMLEDNTLGGTSFSPRLGANYRLRNGDTLRAAATLAHKHPSLLEEHWDAVMRLDDGTPFTQWAKSDGRLDTEQRSVIEVGYLGQRLGGRLQFDARVYHEEVEDAVIYARDYSCAQPTVAAPLYVPYPFCYRIGNYLHYEVNGAELGLSFRPGTRSLVRLGYAYADVDGSVPYYLVPQNPRDLGHTAPRHSGSVLLSHRLADGWDASAVVYGASRTDWYIDGGVVDDYLRLDLRLARRLRLASADTKLELIVQNLGGDYEEFTPANRFDTRVFGRVSIDLD